MYTENRHIGFIFNYTRVKSSTIRKLFETTAGVFIFDHLLTTCGHTAAHSGWLEAGGWGLGAGWGLANYKPLKRERV